MPRGESNAIQFCGAPVTITVAVSMPAVDRPVPGFASTYAVRRDEAAVSTDATSPSRLPHENRVPVASTG